MTQTAYICKYILLVCNRLMSGYIIGARCFIIIRIVSLPTWLICQYRDLCLPLNKGNSPREIQLTNDDLFNNLYGLSPQSVCSLLSIEFDVFQDFLFHCSIFRTKSLICKNSVVCVQMSYEVIFPAVSQIYKGKNNNNNKKCDKCRQLNRINPYPAGTEREQPLSPVLSQASLHNSFQSDQAHFCWLTNFKFLF